MQALIKELDLVCSKEEQEGDDSGQYLIGFKM